jgi:hypothetical protein
MIYGDNLKEDFSFKIRAMHLHPIPWDLNKLTVDTWTLNDWKWYIKFLHDAGCNHFSCHLWPHHYYFPSHPETYENEWRVKVYKEALRYARSLGMKTYLHHNYNAVPPFFIYNYPELEATNPYYRGFLACWSKGKEEIFRLTRQVIDYFADVVDGYILWFRDFGFCGCNECQDYASVVVDYIDTIKPIVGDRSINPCFWGFEGIQEGTIGLGPNPSLRDKVLDATSKENFIIVSQKEDTHYYLDTMEIAKKQGLNVLEFGFFLDPEGGVENGNVLPQPKFHEIEEAVNASIDRGSDGIIAYRLTPYTQFASDWVFYRKHLSPNKSIEEAVAELGHYIYPLESQASDFSKALMLLDNWWRERHMDDLKESVRLLNATRTKTPTNTNHLADAAEILLMLAEHTQKKEPLEDFVPKIQKKMNRMPIFQGFTIDQIWQGTRSKTFLTPRIEWWIQRISK